MARFPIRAGALLLAALVPVPPGTFPARAQVMDGQVMEGQVMDGAEPGVGADEAARVIALLGRTLRSPETARYGRLRPGRAGAVCGEVDTTNRMGRFVGPRRFVADLAGGVAGLVPDGPELRNPGSAEDYAAMQRILALYAANCAG